MTTTDTTGIALRDLSDEQFIERYGSDRFTAGVLAHLPGLLAIAAPSVASYLRLVPSYWAAPFQVWGVENREAALRLIVPPGNPAPTRYADLFRQAPIGHRQPRPSDMSEPVQATRIDTELRRLDEEIDRRLIICRGC